MSEGVTVSLRAEWANRIGEAWRHSVNGILSCARLLVEARNELPHGEFAAMVYSDLPFGDRTAQRLMAIARHSVLSNPTHVSVLPPSWGTLAEIARLPEDEVTALIEDGTIRPDMQRTEITQHVKRERRATRERELGERTIAAASQLNTRLYNVIYADPPWRFEPYSRETGMDRSADNHYPTMTLDEVKSLQVPAAEDCALFLWATVPTLPQALDVMSAWGFTYRSNFVWVKTAPGTGYWNRNRHEHLLIGTRGNVPAPAPGEQYDSVVTQPASAHSVKPLAIREIIEETFPHLPRIELFARGEIVAGWDRWGNEINREDF